MTSDASVREPEGLAEMWTAIRDLARQLFADPDKIRKVIETLKIWGLWPESGFPQAALAAADDERLRTIVAEAAAEAELPQSSGEWPEASRDGRLLDVLRAAVQWAKEHPEILAAILAFLRL